MKKSIILGIVLLFNSVLGYAETPDSSASANQPGRYQIIVASLWNPVEGQSRSTLVKLDSVTGRVWILQRIPATLTSTKGEKVPVLSEGWQEVDKTFAEAAQELQNLMSPAKK